MIYVASSWKNSYQPIVVKALRDEGYEVYDFRNPQPGDTGFHWSQIDPNWQSWTASEYRKNLYTHPLAESGFRLDFDNMRKCSQCVLVLPCGRSAHLEAGWFAGAGKPLHILLESGEPELMYLMANNVCVNLEELLEVLTLEYGTENI